MARGYRKWHRNVVLQLPEPKLEGVVYTGGVVLGSRKSCTVLLECVFEALEREETKLQLTTDDSYSLINGFTWMSTTFGHDFWSRCHVQRFIPLTEEVVGFFMYLKEKVNG